jgi:hypothetical protein
MRRTDKRMASGTTQLALDFTQTAPARPAVPPVVPPRPEPLTALPGDPSERGYQAFHSERAAALQELEQRFGLILNRRVRVTLCGVPAEFVGTLVLAQLLPCAAGHEPLRLRIGTAEFDDADIESCVLL